MRLHKCIALVLLMALTTGLAACTGADVKPAFSAGIEADAQPSSQAASPSAAQDAAAVSTSSRAKSEGAPRGARENAGQGGASAFSANKELTALIGSTNEELKKAQSGKCYAYVTGMGAASLVYYNPYISYLFVPTQNPMEDVWAVDVYGLNPDVEGGVVTETNPFFDNLTVMQIRLAGVYDPSAHVVISQVSLKQFFVTEEQITYTLLCEKLGQKPELTFTPSAFYAPETEYNPQARIPGEEIKGGLYNAVYNIDGVEVTVSFISDKGGYTALDILIGGLVFPNMG